MIKYRFWFAVEPSSLAKEAAEGTRRSSRSLRVKMSGTTEDNVMFALGTGIIVASVTAAAAWLLGDAVLDAAAAVLRWLLAGAPYVLAVVVGVS